MNKNLPGLSFLLLSDGAEPKPQITRDARIHTRERQWQAHVPSPSVGRFANEPEARFHGGMARRLTILTGRNLPKIKQPPEAEASIINEKTIADFTPVVEQTGILKREPDQPRE